MTTNLHHEFAIAAPPERVFAAITDLHTAGRWLPGCTKLEVMTSAPYGKGTRWRETRTVFGRQASEEFEVKEIDPPRIIELHCDGRKGASGNVDYYFRYDLEAKENGTLLKFDGRIEPAGWFGRIMAPLMKPAFQKALHRDHAALKAHVEGNSG